MKSLVEISRQNNIAKSTLVSRIRKHKMELMKLSGVIFVTLEQERIIIQPMQYQYKGLVNKNINTALVWQFKSENPYLSNF